MTPRPRQASQLFCSAIGLGAGGVAPCRHRAPRARRGQRGRAKSSAPRSLSRAHGDDVVGWVGLAGWFAACRIGMGRCARVTTPLKIR